MTDYTRAHAEISPCGNYRYALLREWVPNEKYCAHCKSKSRHDKTIVWILCNPSTADANQDDPTVRKCVEFSRKWGGSRMIIVNVYAYRATNPDDLLYMQAGGFDVVGPDNDNIISQVLSQAQPDLVVAGWGKIAHSGLSEQLQTLYDCGILCVLKLNKDGSPKHPLYAPYKGKMMPPSIREWKANSEYAQQYEMWPDLPGQVRREATTPLLEAPK